MNKIIKNAVHCNTCNTTIESVHRHDFIGCECNHNEPNATSTWCAVDGGKDYLKRSFGSQANFTELSTSEDKNGNPTDPYE